MQTIFTPLFIISPRILIIYPNSNVDIPKICHYINQCIYLLLLFKILNNENIRIFGVRGNTY